MKNELVSINEDLTQCVGLTSPLESIIIFIRLNEIKFLELWVELIVFKREYRDM